MLENVFVVFSLVLWFNPFVLQKLFIFCNTFFLWVLYLSVVISVRIPRKLKKKMDLLGDSVNWSEEIRRFLEARVEELYRLKVLNEVRKVIEQLPEVPRGTVTRYVREDRDSH